LLHCPLFSNTDMKVHQSGISVGLALCIAIRLLSVPFSGMDYRKIEFIVSTSIRRRCFTRWCKTAGDTNNRRMGDDAGPFLQLLMHC
jgi:hypothetical protein